MTHIAFVTSSLSPEMTADDRLAADVLEAGGMAVSARAWDDSRVDWRSFASVVIRSPWNYHLQALAFEQWLRRLEAETVNLWNPAGVILGNMNKRYLLDLAGRGVSIVPTEFLPTADGRDLRAVLECRGWDDAVVKPAVSLGAHGTWRTSRADARVDQARFEAQCRQQDVLLQPCMTEVESEGEWSIVFFGGRYSHAVLKRPAPDDFRVQFHFGGHASAATPPPPLIDQAAQVLAAAGSDLLYARVDGVDHNGRFLLMELEVNEPNLFLAYSADAPARFATAIRAVT